MPTETRGLVVLENQSPMQLVDLVLDDPGPGEVLVRVLANGLCHSDLHFARRDVPAQFPCVLGHEAAAEVERVGPGVDSLKEGDYVVLAYRAPCGTCRFCARGEPSQCAKTRMAGRRVHTRDGRDLKRMLGIGSLASHMVVHADQAVKMDRDVPPEAASLIGCGVMTGVGAALISADVQPGRSVAVFGCGGVGSSVIQGARLAQAGRIIAVDLDPRKLAWAKEFGATDTVNASDGDPVEQIKALTGGLGVDYAFEAVGQPTTLEQTIASCDQSGLAVLIGVPAPHMQMTLQMNAFFRGRLRLQASQYGDCVPVRDFPKLAQWYREGKLKLDELVTRRIRLDEFEDAFAGMERGETLRSVVVF